MQRIYGVLTLSLCCILAACGGDDPKDPPDVTPTSEPTPEPTLEPTPEPSVVTFQEDSPALVAYFPATAYTGEVNGDVILQGLSNDRNADPAISAYLNYSVKVEQAGDYQLSIRYAFGGTETNIRDAWIYVNGNKVTVDDNDILEFAYTGVSNGKWNTYEYSNKVQLPLQAGDNDLRIVAVNTPDYTRDITYSRNGSGGNLGETGQGTMRGLPNIESINIEGFGVISDGEGSNRLYTLIVGIKDGEGEISVSPLQEFYAKDTEVSLTATPADGYQFDSWSGQLISSEPAEQLNMEANGLFNARFVPFGAQSPEDLYGFGAIQSDTTVPYTLTGGLGATETVVTSVEELQAALSGEGPLLIKVSGLIDNANNPSLSLTVPSNTTLYGDPENQGHIRNIELKLQGENYILRNLKLSEVVAVAIKNAAGETLVADGRGNDVISINGGRHIWIDHCELYSSLNPAELYDFAGPSDGPADGLIDVNDAKDFYDGLIDIKNAASFITLSNNYFHDHWKAILIGSSDGNDNGTKATRITINNNLFENINSRIPLLRWGKAHFYNNYVTTTVNEVFGEPFKVDTVVNLRQGSEALIESNVIENAEDSFGLFHASSNTGFWNLEDNVFINVDNPVTESTGSYSPPTSAPLIMPASAVIEGVSASAGVGKLMQNEILN